MEVEQIIAGAAGTLIVGLFIIVWYFVQQYIARADLRDKEMSDTLIKLNGTLSKINLNFEIYQVKTGAELQVIHLEVENLTQINKINAENIENHEIRLQVIEKKDDE